MHTDIIKDISKLRKIYALKQVYRANSVGKRKESSAEHSWSCIMLADFFLDKLNNKLNPKLDRLKVYELLLYHDLIEIEAGDIPIHHEEERKLKKKKEHEALKILEKKLPATTHAKLSQLFNEFENGTTPEARFAKAVDSFDAPIHELDYKDDWKGWTEEMVRKYHGKNISKSPEVQEVFEHFLRDIKNKGYFEK